MKHRLLIAVALVLLGCSSDDEPSPQSPDHWPTTLVELETGMKQQGIPGLGVALVTDGAVSRSAGLGVQSLSGGEPVTSETLFRLGSTTKLFVATTAQSLAEDKKLALDAPVSVPFVSLTPELQTATLDQFLSHRSGVVEAAEEGPCVHGAGGLKAWFDAHQSLGSWVAPGTLFNYSNTGYGIVAAAIEQASGETFTDAIAHRAFAPGGMTGATFEPGKAKSAEHATGHTFDAGGTAIEIPIDDASSACAMIEAAGGAFVSASDYALFLAALIEGKLLGGQALASLLEPRTPTGWGGTYRYGYGVYSLEDSGTRIAMHGGYWPGWSSFVTLVPERGYALVLLSNGGKPEHLGYLWNESLRLTRRFLGLTGDAPTLTTDPSGWSDYEGTYDQIGGPWHFTVSQQADNQLWMKVDGLVGTIGNAALEQGYPPFGNAAGDTFAFHFEKWGGALTPVTFWRDPSGAVTHLANQGFVARRAP